MPFQILRNDITKMQVDAIVNTANPKPVVGAGVDAMIHAAAGPELLSARQQLGDIPTGQAAITPGFRLPAKFVIHTVGPVWQGGSKREEALLRSCFDRGLALAAEQGCQSVAFPLIATGNYGFPKDKALQIAIAAFTAFLMAHDMQLYLVVFDRTAHRLSEKLFADVTQYIDQHYVDSCEKAMFRRLRRQSINNRSSDICDGAPAAVGAMPPKAVSLEEMLRQADAGFSETLLQLIDRSGKKDPEVYKKANLSKQHFSKIRNDPEYRPTKQTALALALALELDLEQTEDLIGRAGYRLSGSSKFDLIIRYHIEHRIYNIVQINMVLYEFDQPLLGS